MRAKKNNKKKWFDCAKLPVKVIKVYDRLNEEATKILLKNKRKEIKE